MWSFKRVPFRLVGGPREEHNRLDSSAAGWAAGAFYAIVVVTCVGVTDGLG
jgi:hypothetical protein